MKRSELVAVEPEILQMMVRVGCQSKHLLKVKNLTGGSINSLFFCLFNQEKFEFAPDSFNLLPHQEKLVTVRLRALSDDGLKRTSNKEFAYLKATQINIRITMLLKYEEEEQDSSNRERYSALESSAPLADKLERAAYEEPRRSPSPTEEEINTLSSRAYLHNQAAAFEKILFAKDEYIAKLQTQLASRADNEQQLQLSKTSEIQMYQNELKQANSRSLRMQSQLKQLTKDHRAMESELHRTKESEGKYHKLYDDEKRVFTQLKLQFGRVVQEKKISEQKVGELEKYLKSRDDRIKQLQQIIAQLRSELHKENNQLVQSMQSKLISQRRNFEDEFGQYQQRLKELEVIAQNSEAMRHQSARFEQQLIRKQEELKHAKSQVQSLRKSIKELESEKLQRVKLEVEHSRISENNQVLANKIARYQQQLEKQRQEISAHKSRVDQHPRSSDYDRASSGYREAALDSRNELEGLRREKMQMERMLLNYATTERFYKDRIDELQRELKQNEGVISNAMRARRSVHENSFGEEMIKLKEENVLLLQKIEEMRANSLEKTNSHLSVMEADLQHGRIRNEQLERELVLKDTELSEANSKIDRFQSQIKQLEKEMYRYKDDLREDLNHINQAAMEQIRKLTADKKKLNRKLAELSTKQLVREEKAESKARLDERDKVSSKATKKHKQKGREATETNQSSPHANKLQNIETQLVLMREQLTNFRETAQNQGSKELIQSRKSGGIHNQRRQVYDSRNKSQSYITPMVSGGVEEELHRELGELREIEKVIENEQRRFRSLFGVEVEDDYPGRSVMKVISLFKAIEDALRNARSHNHIIEMAHRDELDLIEKRQLGKQNESRLANQPNYSHLMAPTNLNASAIEEKNPKLYEYLQEEMKAQYKKLNETIQLCHEKYELLRKKIYNEYRSKLTDLFGRKDRTQIPRLQQLLEKFVQGLSNTSHKEAMLSKEVRKKLELRRENEQMKSKIAELQLIIQDKKGACSREPIKIISGKRPEDYLHESVRLEAQLLTCQAENRRLLQELSLSNENAQSATVEFKNSICILEEKEDEILKLKSQILEIDRVHKQEVASMVAEMDSLKTQYLKVNELEQQVLSLSHKQKECSQLRRELNRKRQLIDALKEKEKNLLDVIEKQQKGESDNRHRTSVRDREEELSKLQEIIGQLRDKSKELRAEIQSREQSERRLLEQVEKKNAYIASLKASNTRQLDVPNATQLENVRLSTEMKQLQQRLNEAKGTNTKLTSTIDNLKTKISELEKQVAGLINQARTNGSDWLIKEKSLTSIIRSAVEMLRRLWRLLEIKAKKMHPSVQQTGHFDTLVKDIYKIDMIRLYDGFEELARDLGRE